MKNLVRELRTEAGLTQQQLAEMVHVSSRTIISLEKGQYNPSLLLGLPAGVGVRHHGGGAVLSGGEQGTGGPGT